MADTISAIAELGNLDDLLDARLRALAHPARRTMLRAALRGERTAGDLARLAKCTKPSASLHLKTLREAGLVIVRAEGTTRWYRTDTTTLQTIAEAMSVYWDEAFDHLDRAVRRRAGGR
jgi:DNA-binding transcriptional ArsR family regulator